MRSLMTGTLSMAGLALSLALSADAQQPATPATQATPASPARPATVLGGYLPAAKLPSSLALVPPPPAPGSAAMARDQEANQAALALHGTPRWEMATRDAVLTLPEVAQTFSCALDIPVSNETSPRVVALLRKVLLDAGRSTSDAKEHYKRARPFESNGKPICTPEAESRLRGNASYPSGHAAIGFAFGLALSQAAPDRTDALVARGRAFGDSRLVCNVHWTSDVAQGQLMAAAVMARLNAEIAFRDDVAAARAEIDALRAKNARSDRDCATEAQVLKTAP